MSARTCGTCQLCCTLLPVRNVIAKPAATRCVHQRFGKGCAVYHKAGMPPECGMWSCRWLLGSDTADLRRPDRSGYVVDPSPEFVVSRNNETGEETPIPVIQIWVDPKRREAHRDPALRAYLRRRAADEGAAAIVRFNETDAFVLFAPELTGAKDFAEVHSNTAPRASHSPEEIAATLGVEALDRLLDEAGIDSPRFWREEAREG